MILRGGPPPDAVDPMRPVAWGSRPPMAPLQMDSQSLMSSVAQKSQERRRLPGPVPTPRRREWDTGTMPPAPSSITSAIPSIASITSHRFPPIFGRSFISSSDWTEVSQSPSVVAEDDVCGPDDWPEVPPVNLSSSSRAKTPRTPGRVLSLSSRSSVAPAKSNAKKSGQRQALEARPKTPGRPFSPFIPERRSIASRENAILFPPGLYVKQSSTGHTFQKKRSSFKYRVASLPLQTSFPNLSHPGIDIEAISPRQINLQTAEEAEKRAKGDPLRDIRQHFMNHCPPNTETLDRLAFQKACRTLFISSVELMDKLFDEFDDDGSGFVTADEVCENLRDFIGRDPALQLKLFGTIYKLWDNDGSGEITMQELQNARGSRTSVKFGISDYQRATLIKMFRFSRYIDRSGSMSKDEFALLMQREPELVKAMFSTIAALWGAEHGIDLDPGPDSSKASSLKVQSQVLKAGNKFKKLKK